MSRRPFWPGPMALLLLLLLCSTPLSGQNRRGTDEGRLLRAAAAHESRGDFDEAESALRQLLEADPSSSGGLFALERKRPLPLFPQRVAIITSRTAAALQDMLHILRRDPPSPEIVLVPALMQGQGAAASVCAALLNLRAGRFQSRLVTNGPLLQATASYYPQRSIGPFTIRATALMENAQQAVALLQAEIELLADQNYFSRRDYEHASAGLQVQVASWRDDIWIEVGQTAAGWALAGLDYVDSYPDSLQAVTPADVRKCLSNYLIGQPLVTAVMVDEGTGKSIILREVLVP